MLESAGFANGRIVSSGNTYTPQYHLTDHLESVRAVTDLGHNAVEGNDYYPFGARWDQPLLPVSQNRYRYNAKEDQSFARLPYIDYGARMYDPTKGRWNGVDPLAEKYSPLGPYVFCANNPINLID